MIQITFWGKGGYDINSKAP